ncbi:MAG: low molecular weight phosphotyrosine protein phosphatase, partial [Opitutales bacterium]
MRRPRNVLLVCMGNICRSPTAEEVLRVKAREAGLEMLFDSAGTEGYHVGDPPDA